jgi:hypothetical protein
MLPLDKHSKSLLEALDQQVPDQVDLEVAEQEEALIQVRMLQEVEVEQHPFQSHLLP